jgi:hypothetical protein
MKKIAAAAVLVCAFPAFAWKPNFNFLHKHQTPHPSHPQNIHPQNPNLAHPVRHKPHPVEQHHA